MAGLKTITGILRFISQYKQLSLEITEVEFNKISKFENHSEKKLAWLKNIEHDPDARETYHTKVNLIKYLKDDESLMKIEDMLNKKINCKVQIRHYDSDEYGQGTTLVARRVWAIKT